MKETKSVCLSTLTSLVFLPPLLLSVPSSACFVSVPFLFSLSSSSPYTASLSCVFYAVFSKGVEPFSSFSPLHSSLSSNASLCVSYFPITIASSTDTSSTVSACPSSSSSASVLNSFRHRLYLFLICHIQSINTTRRLRTCCSFVIVAASNAKAVAERERNSESK